MDYLLPKAKTKWSDCMSSLSTIFYNGRSKIANPLALIVAGSSVHVFVSKL